MSKINTKNFSELAKRAACVAAGLVVGSQISKLVSGNRSVDGTDLLGLSGTASKYTTPAIVAAAGFLGSSMSSNPMMKDISLGIAVAGGAGLLNAATGKSIVALGDTEDQPLQIIPGIGDMEEEEELAALPQPDDMNAANELSTSYNEVVIPGSDVEFATEDDGVDGLAGDELL